MLRKGSQGGASMPGTGGASIVGLDANIPDVVAPRWDWATSFALAALALCASGWTWAVTGTWNPGAFTILLLLSLGCYRGGRSLTTLLALDSHFVLDFLVGSAAV